MIDDRLLIADALAGDNRAFSQLLQRHDDKMRGVVWPLVSAVADMDDILQDAYLKAWRGLGSFRGDAAFSSWLYRIVYTTTLDHLKKVSRHPVVPLQDMAHEATDDVGASVAASVALRSALAELPADQLAVVALVDGEGESYEAVAELLGISPGTVGSRLSRARASLRKQMQDQTGGVQ